MESLDTQAPAVKFESMAEKSDPQLPPSVGITADLLHTATCPYCGRRPKGSLATLPFALLVSLARLVVAIGAAISLVGIVVTLLRWGVYRFVAGELWALFATFVVSVGVLVLYEIRDLLREPKAPPQPDTFVPGRRVATVPTMSPFVLTWQTIGAFGSLVWLPFQSQRDRLLIEHLTPDERRELLHRLATVTVCIAATTIAPVLIAFAFLSPVAVCIAATVIASNLFVHDWFKKRHKLWLASTAYANQHPVPAQASFAEPTDFT
ncbi:MAG TPA: hypothetical protein VFI31_10455 [Pirellulales bacterium]|nr:hypothetical protein [Pirellulales bacterium]